MVLKTPCFGHPLVPALYSTAHKICDVIPQPSCLLKKKIITIFVLSITDVSFVILLFIQSHVLGDLPWVSVLYLDKFCSSKHLIV